MRQHHHSLALYLALCFSVACAVEKQVVLRPGDGNLDGETCAPISDAAFDELAGDIVSAYGNATYDAPLYSIHLSPYERMLVCVPQRRLSVERTPPTCIGWNATAPSDIVNKDGSVEVAYRRGASSSHTLSALSRTPLLLPHAHARAPASLPLRLSVPYIQNAYAHSNLAFSLGTSTTIDRPVRHAAHAVLRMPQGVPGCRIVVPVWRCEADARVSVPLRLRGSVAFYPESAAPDASPTKVPVEHIVREGVTWAMDLRSSEEWEGIPRVVCDPRAGS
ncbi:hypothetical protein AURDEDRAFT_114224 [Auricularia subglabra TFB-10046 SS5]|nr:hypothetical protein AURDEDRAFT_114224 [Auricularia subglabra TFB-10046 SS5]